MEQLARSIHAMRAQNRFERLESQAEKAAQSMFLAIGDFNRALQQAQTVDEALRIRAIIVDVQREVNAAETAANNRAEEVQR